MASFKTTFAVILTGEFDLNIDTINMNSSSETYSLCCGLWLLKLHGVYPFLCRSVLSTREAWNIYLGSLSVHLGMHITYWSACLEISCSEAV